MKAFIFFFYLGMRDAYEPVTLQTGDHVESVPRWDMRMHIVPRIRSIIYTSGERGEKVFFHQIISRSGAVGLRL